MPKFSVSSRKLFLWRLGSTEIYRKYKATNSTWNVDKCPTFLGVALGCWYGTLFQVKKQTLTANLKTATYSGV